MSHLDECFLKPKHQQPIQRTLEEEWENEVKKCSHPRWRRKTFRATLNTYFTCQKCGDRRRQAVAPMSFKMSQEEAEDWFEKYFPSFSSSSCSSSIHNDRPRWNERLIHKQQQLLEQERHPAGMAKMVTTQEMMQSDMYCQITAQVHAFGTKLRQRCAGVGPQLHHRPASFFISFYLFFQLFFNFFTSYTFVAGRH